jgi:hypothetical protein
MKISSFRCGLTGLSTFEHLVVNAESVPIRYLSALEGGGAPKRAMLRSDEVFTPADLGNRKHKSPAAVNGRSQGTSYP